MGMVLLLLFWLTFFCGTVYSGFMKEELPAGVEGAFSESKRGRKEGRARR